MTRFAIMLGGLFIMSSAVHTWALELPFKYVQVAEEKSHAYLDITSTSAAYTGDFYTANEYNMHYRGYAEGPRHENPAQGLIDGLNLPVYYPLGPGLSTERLNQFGVSGGSVLGLNTDRSELDLSAKHVYFLKTLALLETDALIKFDGTFDELIYPTGEQSYLDFEVLIDDVSIPLTINDDTIAGERIVSADWHTFTVVISMYAELDTTAAAPVGEELVAAAYEMWFSAAPVPEPATGMAILLITGVLSLARRRS